MSEPIERPGEYEVDEAVAAAVGGGGGGLERGRSPSGGELPPPPATPGGPADDGPPEGIPGDELGEALPADGSPVTPARLGGRYTGRSPRLARPVEPIPAIT